MHKRQKDGRGAHSLLCQALAETGLNVGQFSLLWNLDSLDQSNVARLAEALGLERTTVVRNLKPLLADGYIDDMIGDNSRDRKLVVTAKGKAALTKAIPLWKEAQKKMRSVIGQENVQIFKDVQARLQQV